MSTLDPEGRALIQAGRDALRPDAGARERILDGLRARTGEAPLDPAGAPTAPAASGLGWPAISAIVVGLALAGGVLLRVSQTVEPATAPASPSPPPTTALVVPSEGPSPAPVLEAPPAQASAAPAAERSPAPRRASDSLAEEVKLLSRAEQELHSGRFAVALQVLGEHQRKYPRGTLSQERVAARIQALCGLGRVKEADAELARVSPGSLHGGTVRKACAASRAK